MPKVVLDRRVQKTRQLLKDALITLMLEKGFEAVTIQEILERANVGRSTFYLHFGNKYELLHSCFDEFHDLFEQHAIGASNRKRNSKALHKGTFLFDLFQLVKQNHRLFKALLGKDDMAQFNHPVYQYLFIIINENIKEFDPNRMQTPLQLEMLAHSITSAFLGTLAWWVHKDMPCPVEEVDKYFKQFIMYGLRNVAGPEAVHLFQSTLE